MRHIKPVFPLAAAIALTLALVSGILFISDSRVYAADPEFVTGAGTRSVPENTPPGVNIGDPISATDDDETGDDAIEFGNTLTYSLSGTDAASFEIDEATGQLITKAPLDEETKSSYSVTVTVDDGEERESPVTQPVTITVTDVNELPGMPPPPTVVSGEDNTGTANDDESTTTLKIVWHPLVNTGRETITGYEVQYKRSTETSFGDANATVTGTTAVITGLSVGTAYQVRVRANNTDVTANNGPWSLVGTGSTNKAGNSSPNFTQTSPYMLTMAENSPPGQGVGVPVTADDADSRDLSYRFGGRDADSFDFNSSTGQIRTKRGVTYNHEDARCGYVDTADPTVCTYYVTVVADDGAGGSDALRVEIRITDRDELPSAPGRPTVRPTAKSRTSLDVSWSAPANTGPAITGYTVEYRLKGSSDDFSVEGVVITGTTAKISGDDTANNTTWLAPGTSYEVRVRATNAEGTGDWAPLGTGRTNVGNREPVFRDRNIDVTPVGTDATTTRELNENTQSGRPVGLPVAADDGDGDARSYKMVAVTPGDAASDAAVAKFDINGSTGQIMTKDPLNHEDEDCGYIPGNDTLTSTTPTTCTYTVVVEVRDGLDANRVTEDTETEADDKITVTITVNDVTEIPSVPTVTLGSPQDVTMLNVNWYGANTGPPLTTVDLQYRQGSGNWEEDNCNTVVTPEAESCKDIPVAADGTSLTRIESLTANTLYSVRMRARNVEGTSAWSSAVSQRTNRNKAADTPNSVPTFTNTIVSLEVDESHERSAQDVGTISTNDSDGGTVRYSLEGANKNLFTINSSGLIRTRSGLDFEDDACVTDTTDPTQCIYDVLVKIDDGQGASALMKFDIKIQDVAEPPSAPSPPRVTPTTGSGMKLDVTWSEPGNTGPDITDYDIQYREVGGAPAWIELAHGADMATDATGDTTTKATIEDLDPRTTYEVEVRATNAEGTSGWSNAGRGSTNASNLRPSFDDTGATAARSVGENTGPGQPVGSPVSATDNDGNRLTYTLEGPGKDSFTIVSSSGQIRTKAALDREERSSYAVTVKVDDGQRKANSTASKSVTIEIANVVERPSAPAAPAVSGIPSSTSSVRVTWDAPANTGPEITDYDVQYGVAGTGGFSDWIHQGVDKSTIITGLTAGTNYEVRVRARNADGPSVYSQTGRGSPNPDVANRDPVFIGSAHTFSVDENTASGDPIGDSVEANDPDDDPLSYELEGTDAAAFTIDRSSGQIRTYAALNHEEKPRYSVVVRARDGRGGTSTANVTINISDLSEPPSTPLSPTITAVSSTSVQVSWDAPDNIGPPITDYDYRYREPGDAWTEVTYTTITGTTVRIVGLAASTSYDVEVLAKNAEGSSDWSSSGIGSTNAAGANNPPVFVDGVTASRSVSAGAAAGTNIGAPVRATDADAGEVVSYRLEGRDATLFNIVSATGQLQTKAGVNLIANEDYTVIVVADDGTDTARITVTITATAAAPNDPPVFADGASTTRSVADNVAAGSNIGAPVAANDPGDTLTYTLGGTDAASFNIVSTTGQLQTRAALDASVKSSYTVTVTATDTAGGSDTITVTITVTAGSSLIDRYDANNNGRIDKSEMITAINDYLFNETLTKPELIQIINLYLFG